MDNSKPDIISIENIEYPQCEVEGHRRSECFYYCDKADCKHYLQTLCVYCKIQNKHQHGDKLYADLPLLFERKLKQYSDLEKRLATPIINSLFNEHLLQQEKYFKDVLNYMSTIQNHIIKLKNQIYNNLELIYNHIYSSDFYLFKNEMNQMFGQTKNKTSFDQMFKNIMSSNTFAQEENYSQFTILQGYKKEKEQTIDNVKNCTEETKKQCIEGFQQIIKKLEQITNENQKSSIYACPSCLKPKNIQNQYALCYACFLYREKVYICETDSCKYKGIIFCKFCEEQLYQLMIVQNSHIINKADDILNIRKDEQDISLIITDQQNIGDFIQKSNQVNLNIKHFYVMNNISNQYSQDNMHSILNYLIKYEGVSTLILDLCCNYDDDQTLEKVIQLINKNQSLNNLQLNFPLNIQFSKAKIIQLFKCLKSKRDLKILSLNFNNSEVIDDECLNIISDSLTNLVDLEVFKYSNKSDNLTNGSLNNLSTSLSQLNNLKFLELKFYLNTKLTDESIIQLFINILYNLQLNHFYLCLRENPNFTKQLIPHIIQYLEKINLNKEDNKTLEYLDLNLGKSPAFAQEDEQIKQAVENLKKLKIFDYFRLKANEHIY